MKSCSMIFQSYTTYTPKIQRFEDEHRSQLLVGRSWGPQLQAGTAGTAGGLMPAGAARRERESMMIDDDLWWFMIDVALSQIDPTHEPKLGHVGKAKINHPPDHHSNHQTFVVYDVAIPTLQYNYSESSTMDHPKAEWVRRQRRPLYQQRHGQKGETKHGRMDQGWKIWDQNKKNSDLHFTCLNIYINRYQCTSWNRVDKSRKWV